MTAASTLTGAELIAGVQGGANVKITANQQKTWSSNAPTLVTPVLGVATGTSLATTAQIWSGAVSSALTTLTGAVDGFRGSATNVTLLGAENTTASSATQGAFVGMYSNDGAAMASGDRLGGIRMGGSSSASAIRNSALIAGFADQAWVDASAYGSRLEFQTTTNDATSATTKVTIINNGNAGFGTTSPQAPFDLKYGGTLHVRIGSSTGDTPSDGYLDLRMDPGLYGIIEPYVASVGYKDLVLIPNGGNVGVGTATTSTKLTVNGVITACSGTATPAGGSTSARLLFGTTAGFGIYYGSGAPSSLTAGQGSFYMRSDGSTSITRAYINTDGSTTWTPVTTVG